MSLHEGSRLAKDKKTWTKFIYECKLYTNLYYSYCMYIGYCIVYILISSTYHCITYIVSVISLYCITLITLTPTDKLRGFNNDKNKRLMLIYKYNLIMQSN